MKTLFTYVALSIILFTSCKKDDSLIADKTFVANLSNDKGLSSIGTIQLDDSSFITAATDIFNWDLIYRNEGKIFKTDKAGSLVWKKPIPKKNLFLYQIFKLSGNEFATIGASDFSSTFLTVTVYNQNGDVIAEHRINVNTVQGSYEPFQILKLANGNYLLGSGNTSMFGVGELKVLDPDFNLLYATYINWPDNNYRCVNIRGMCQQNDGSIAITAFTRINWPVFHSSMMQIRVDDRLNILSNKFLKDTIHNNLPNCIANYNNGTIVFSGSGDANGKDWAFVNYWGNSNSNGDVIAGDMNLTLFDGNGNSTGNKIMHNYPELGNMNALIRTSDGNYVACGTVGQLYNPFIVSFTKIFVEKLDANLNVIWTRLIETDYPEFATSIIETYDGNYLITGNIKTFNNHFDGLLVKMDKNGNY